MKDRPTLFGEELKLVIPQREPVMMVDRIFCGEDGSAEGGLTVSEECIFCDEGRLSEPGLIEHVAQSAAAMMGCIQYFSDPHQAPRPGYIGEIKKFRIAFLPAAGTELRTTVRTLGEAAGVTLVSAVTYAGDEEVASCQMKLYIDND